jgi:hypothetical protein
MQMQAELFDVRTLYAQAIAVREALEARTAQAEAEKAAADSTWQSAKAQVRRVWRGALQLGHDPQ